MLWVRARQALRGSRTEQWVQASPFAPTLRRFYAARLASADQRRSIDRWSEGLASRSTVMDPGTLVDRVGEASGLYVLSRLSESVEVLRSGHEHDEVTGPLEPEELRRVETGLKGALTERSGPRTIIVAFGNDDYTRVTGGIQVCVGEEQLRLNESGYNYVYLFPRGHQRSLRPPKSDPVMRAIVNGSPMPVELRMSDWARILSSLQQPGSLEGWEMTYVIHGLLGHSTEALSKCIESTPGSETLLWLHDYYTLCSSAHLAHDDLAHCGRPYFASSACLTCVHGSARHQHLSRMAALAEKVRPRMIAPSPCAAETFSQTVRASGVAWPPLEVEVVSHGEIAWHGERPATPEDEPLTVAFVGLPLPHKGWLVFRELARALRDDSRYRFIHLGAEQTADVPFSHLHQTGRYSAAATAMLKALDVHAVFAWSQWPETFHIVTHEAMAAGCVIITSPESGNVHDSARQHGRLVAFESVDALWQAFMDGSARDAIVSCRQQDRRVGEFVFTGLTSAALTTA